MHIVDKIAAIAASSENSTSPLPEGALSYEDVRVIYKELIQLKGDILLLKLRQKRAACDLGALAERLRKEDRET